MSTTRRAAKKPVEVDVIEKLMKALSSYQCELDVAVCPFCKSRRLNIELIAQCGIRVVCYGVLPVDDARAYSEGECSYSYYIPTASSPKPRNLVSVTFEPDTLHPDGGD